MSYREILDDIRNNNISLDDINNLDCSEINKVILIFVYYEVNKLDFQIPNFLKIKKIEFEYDVEAEKIIRKLLERSRQKMKLFDVEFYENMLTNCSNKNKENKTTYDLNYLEAVNYIKNQISEGNIKDALAICEDQKYSNSPIVQFCHIKILNNCENLEEALKICKKQNFKHNTNIRMLQIKILIKLGRIEAALAVCNEPFFKNNSVIQGQHIRILFNYYKNDKGINKALEICQKSNFYNKYSVQTVHINILLDMGNIDEALRICNRDCFQLNQHIQEKHMKILISLDRIDEALAIGTKPCFVKCPAIQELVIQIKRDNLLRLISDLNEIKENKIRKRLQDNIV